MAASATVRPIVVGNWKMHGKRDSLPLIREVAQSCDALGESAILGLCVPTTLLYVATTLAEGTALAIGAQDCHADASGAHTGDISAEMIADCFASLCIVGHSERRQNHGETSADVRAKAQACIRAGLTPIVYIGETDEENAAGRTEAVLAEQIDGSLPDAIDPAGIIVAYEPVWAIGTGRVPGNDDVARIHAFLRERLIERHGADARAVPILYGGSVKPGNAAELLSIAEVGGALVGGASLKADDLLGIAHAATGQTRSGN